MAESKLQLSLVIPTFNEEKRLPWTLDALAEWIPTSCFDVELIIVDDGSKDRTREVAESYRDRIPNTLFVEVPHLGQMNATITGLKTSKRPLRATLEADAPVHPRMLESFARDLTDYDIVMGSRVLRDSVTEGKPFYRRILSSVMTKLFFILIKGGIHDPQIGFKLFRAEVLEKVLPLLTLKHDGLKSSEIIVKSLALGYRIKEVPVQYKHDNDSKCVPQGSYLIVARAAWALVELWAKTYVEYRRGEWPVCPVRFGFLMAPFWRLLPFEPTPTVQASQGAMPIPGVNR